MDSSRVAALITILINSESLTSKEKADISQELADLAQELADLAKNEMREKHPYGFCITCGMDLNSELLNEYDAKYCHKCGSKLFLWEEVGT